MKKCFLRVRLLIFYLLLPIFLSSCAAELTNYSFYGAADSKKNTFRDRYGMKPPSFSFPFFGTETSCDRNINFTIYPKDAGRAYGLAHFMLIPYPVFTKSKDDTKIKIAINSVPDNVLRDDFKFSLRIGDKIYEPEEENGLIFPVTIKDVGKKGGIIVEYKDIKKEVPFKYGRRWFLFMFFING